jgi:hypothetical protein
MDDSITDMNAAFVEMNEIIRRGQIKAIARMLQGLLDALPEIADKYWEGKQAVTTCYAKTALEYCNQILEVNIEETSRNMVRQAGRTMDTGGDTKPSSKEVES